jgi:hypothetical protein
VELSELSAREGIRDLVARYNSNGDAGRFPQLLDLFTPTAVMEIPDETGATHRYEGRDAIMSMFSSLKAGFDEALGPEDSPTSSVITQQLIRSTSSTTTTPMGAFTTPC